jgi:quercetin dioxygenase-like cupin family protein
MIDYLKREFLDELTDFATRYTGFKMFNTLVPYDKPLSFVEGVTGLVLYRQPPFQVQLFIVQPNVLIPEHHHPNVDSYEYLLHGMNFSYKGHWLVKNYGGEHGEHQGTMLRVHPEDKHGAEASALGGAFMSIQQWNNGVFPSSVGNDWVGETMGEEHTKCLK